jgi:hypothetical protein
MSSTISARAVRSSMKLWGMRPAIPAKCNAAGSGSIFLSSEK